MSTFIFPLAGCASSPVSLTEAQQVRMREVQALAPSGFSVIAQPPFIVAGDEPLQQVQERAEHAVRWTVNRLKQDFFQREPDDVIAIWLFKNRASYETNVVRIFKEAPLSPFGYYSPRHRALIMNISTGGGTLVHEIVHPFVRADFPLCPAWFNEGLASLFEQCAEKDGHIHGLPNWRLPGLQAIIRAGRTLPFDRFTAMPDLVFYGGTGGYNQHYGQARYLCYYLQEHGLLVKFYQEFREHVAADPTGYLSLKKVLQTEDMSEFLKQWEAFVLKLHYP